MENAVGNASSWPAGDAPKRNIFPLHALQYGVFRVIPAE